MIDHPPDDPVYLHSRREALAILLLWGGAFAWTITYCYQFGYGQRVDTEQLDLVMGMPSWVVWGVAAPWIVCGTTSILMSLYFIQDDDLTDAKLSDANGLDTNGSLHQSEREG